jgi:hypothetical protein
MIKDAKKGEEGEWIKGHIIHHKDLGPEIYENIRPICLECNKEDKRFVDSYEYMVFIGTMTAATRKEEIEKIKTLGERLARDRTPINCLLCENKKKPHSEYCGVHDRTDYHFKYKKYVRLMERQLERDLTLLNYLMNNEKENREEIKIVAEVIQDTLKVLNQG